MDRIRSRFQRNRLRLQQRMTEASTTPTFTTFDDIELGPTSIAYPLEFLSDRFWEATIVQSAIVNAIGNIRATEERCCSDYQYGQQSSSQLQVRTQVHCNQVQRLAQLANRHAQLCISFSHTELVSGTVEAIEDLTYRLAIHGCFAEIHNHNIIIKVFLKTKRTNHPLHPDVQHPLVTSIVAKWYLPAFHCSLQEFHQEI
jgi:hypothetical protein